MKEKLYFWYSEKQRQIRVKMRGAHKIEANINGDILEYTECNSRKKPAGLWDDYKYLGTGTIYKINGVIQ